nr:immunoglobulin light chain junction region [Macaca mulatta]MOX69065.1 immunoglobulin light chain junction region [Macaca mulatta]MOX69116.1 immunoglobulin light chain junction region [Macaca mulatta]MOX69916.1 immunoglobulin light chain junction region [Macaca mulatta]MOX70009.1 immunoglobulin light chain junction region [Macaca mulatta]
DYYCQSHDTSLSAHVLF